MKFVLVRILWLSCLLAGTVSANAQVFLSELMANNTTTLTDQDGEYSDWIELHNAGPTEVNLGGWYLTDSADDLTKWRFPVVFVPANGYLVVFASGKDRALPNAQLHTSFNLSANGEYLALVQPDGKTVASEFAPEFPEQFDVISYGRFGSENFYFNKPSPGAANVNGFIAFVAAPKFSHDRGFYDASFVLNITTATPEATIRYSTNGIPPSTTNGVIYAGPITIDRTTVVRAAAFKFGYQPSKVDTQTYLFLDDIIHQASDGKAPPGWPTSWGSNTRDYGMDPDVVNNPTYSGTIKQDLKTIPSFCVVTDLKDLFNSSTGIYANPGQDGRTWERPCSLELIYPDSARKGFQINAGIRIRGGFSRSTGNPKHAFRFFFRDEYGEAKLKFPLFGKNGTDTFDAIDLRTFQNYSWSFQGDGSGIFVRDQFSRDTQLEMGHQGERGDFCHLYINGMYWGLFNTCERPEASFGATYYGGNKEDYDVIKVEAGPYSINATDGNMSAWNQLYTLCKAGLTNNDAYFRIQGRNPDGTPNPAYPNLVDAVNLIDYMLVIVYGGNLDAPISNFLGNTSPNNWYGLRNRAGPDGFRFFAHDAEHTLLNVNENRVGPFPAGDSSVTKSSPQWVWQKMWANQEFRVLCADRIHRHFFNNGALTPQAARDRFNRRTAEIDRAVVGESARWGDAKRSPPLTRANWLSAVNNVRNNFLPRRSDIVLTQLKNKKLYPAIVAPSFNQHGGNIEPGFNLTISAPAGTIYYTMDGIDPRVFGGAVSPGARVYSGPVAMRESVRVKARVLSGSEWSALNEADFTIAQHFKDLLVTEIMYNPPNENGQDGDDFEFVELKNVGAQRLDLSNVHFTEGINFSFPIGTVIEPGGFVVLVSNPSAFITKYPNVPAAGTYLGHLSNGGEKITLVHATGEEITSVDFKDGAPWPSAADGSGFSLVPVNPNFNPDPNEPLNWRASSKLGGSPGADDAPAVAGFAIIHEISTHSDPFEIDQIELYNPTANAVDLSNWYLTDDRTTPKKFRIPAGAVLPAGGYKIFTESDFNSNPGVDPSFSLSSHGEEVYLFSADATGNLTGFSDGFSFGASANGVSFGRFTNSVGTIQYPAQRSKTLGSANAGPAVGPVVINEIQYQPFSSEEEFIELKNITGNALTLYDPERPTNTWKLEGVSFEFPVSFELPANGLIVVTSTDPGAFRTRYGVPASVPVLGPYSGSLQDNGELLRLLRPDTPDTTPDGQPDVPYVAVDEVRYNNMAPWPTNAAGFGPSLERVTANAYGNDPVNWRASFGPPSPGVENGGNRAPRVNAGADQLLQAATFPTVVNLAGTASDDGQPNPPGTLTARWSQVSGPGPAIFANPNQLATTVSFPGIGAYVLQLSANDGELQSSDAVTITIERASSQITLVTTGSVWKYWDKGTDLGTTWREPGFSDTTWASGRAQLGYGDGDEATTVQFGPDGNNKYRTTYFRRTFNVNNAASVTALTIKVLRDDGAVAYINGKEVFRSNMPEDNVSFDTFASATVSGEDESSNFYDGAVDPAVLVNGANVLAVEVHQVNLNSSDISFDLELSGLAQPANQAPVVNAGPDATVMLGSPGSLSGTATDDGLPIPPGSLSVSWSKVTGPGPVTFANANAAVTTATFSEPGPYVLRLTATDGALSAQDDVAVTVTGETLAAWKAKYFSAAELADPNVGSDLADPDGDRHTNAQEFVAGTNPRDALSVLKALSVTHSTGGVKIRFSAVAGKTYSVQSRNSVGPESWSRLQDVGPQGSDGIVELLDSSGGVNGNRYYRIVTPQQP
ncbi:MAG: lamin tail domain-containing protein [Verrucomicrobiales bacterium]|nr:lamin tail domain-containing protein [Verrucomicrobiales bacterium]